MAVNRRTFMQLGLGCAASSVAQRVLAQGVAAHKAKPVAPQAPSGRPFNAHFVDVGAAAGLHAPTIYGGVDTKKYILESTGCGCAFIDYDNDGWMDIFLLCGTRLEGAPPGATNRLYKNNRDGTFTDVTEKAGLHAAGWASGVCVGDYNNDGFDDLFCHLLRAKHSLPQQWRRHFHRCHQAGRPAERTSHAGARAAAFWITTATATWISSSPITSFRSIEHAPVPGANSNCNWKGIPVELRSARPAHRPPLALSKQRGRHVYGCQRAIGCCGRDAELRNDSGRGRFG